MSLDKMHQLVGSLAKALDDNQKIATPMLANKLAKYTATYPHDKTIGGISRVIKDMTDHNTLFICKADFKSLYHQHHTFGTKFADLFQDELGIPVSEPSITTFKHDESIKSSVYEVGDQVLSNALNSAFDKHLPLKMYSQSIAEKAMKSVGSTLDAWNLKATHLTIGDGNDKFIVVKADYDTPKGMTSFYVPVEINKNDVIDPEVFMGNYGPEDLNHKAIKSYLTQHSGTKTKIGATDILTALTHASSDKREVSAAELAVIRLNASRQNKSEFFQDQIVGLKTEAMAKKDVELPKSDEFSSFEKKFTSLQGLASWKFGADVVNVVRNHIVREILSFGFTNPQVIITGNDENTIFCGVSLGTGKTAFTVPVKISNKNIQKPTIILCNGSISSFDKSGINEFVSENKIDCKVAAVSSNMASLKPSEILDNLRQAIADENYTKAEDALNVLANSGDDKAYAFAFHLYMNGLSGVKVVETKCSKMMKSANSEYPVCSHTGLPINKVYQDKNGYCHPLYRKGMSETYEGASFVNAKIFG